MIKAIEVIVVTVLLIFAFLAGVKYSDSVKNRANWLFETKEEEVELPDLSNETPAETDVEEVVPPADGTVNPAPSAPQDSTPMDSLDTAPRPKQAPAQ